MCVGRLTNSRPTTNLNYVILWAKPEYFVVYLRYRHEFIPIRHSRFAGVFYIELLVSFATLFLFGKICQFYKNNITDAV